VALAVEHAKSSRTRRAQKTQASSKSSSFTFAFFDPRGDAETNFLGVALGVQREEAGWN
jgi:hypothetical protein